MLPKTLLKTGTYCLMHFTVAILVAYALTRDWRLALAVGIVEPLVQTCFFYMHETVWSKVPDKVSVWSRMRLWPRGEARRDRNPSPSRCAGPSLSHRERCGMVSPP
jgi:uncharacterized membrane protein